MQYDAFSRLLSTYLIDKVTFLQKTSRNNNVNFGAYLFTIGPTLTKAVA